MLRTILGIIAGIIVGVFVVALVEGIGHMIWPPPEGDLKDPEYLKSIMHEIPFASKMSVIVAWGLGVFVGGVVARLVSRRYKSAAWVVAAFILGAGVWTMTQIPHPLWMQINAVAVTIFGAVFANMVTKRKLVPL